MKARLFAPLIALGIIVGGAPVAAAEVETAPATTGFTFYSTIADMFSCTYYPTRPWCPNPFG